MKKSIFLFALIILATQQILTAQGKSSVRISAPFYEESNFSSDELSFSQKDKPSSSGFSINYLGSSGFGIGYTSITTQGSVEIDLESTCCVLQQESRFESQFIDVFFSMGSDYTLTFGYGALIGGKGENEIFIDYNESVLNRNDEVVSINSDSVSGSSSFFILGSSFESFELFVGYRRNSLKYTFDYSEISAEDSKVTNNLESAEAFFGIGIFYE